MFRKQLITAAIFLLSFTSPVMLFGQFGAPPDPGGPPSKANPPLGGGSAPIGGGLGILLTLGGIYAFKKYRQAVEMTSEDSE